MLATVLVALAAAVAFGWSTAAMHHSAARAPGHVGGPLSLVRHLVVQRRWLGGMAASLLGLGLHTLALRIGSLAVVQPLVVTGLVFTFVFRAVLERELPPRRVVGWAATTALGLGVFLVAAGSTTGTTSPQGPAPFYVLGTGAVAASVCWQWSYRTGRSSTGLLLGIAGGVVFGLIGGTLKATAGSDGVVDALSSWPLYVLGVLGVAGFLTNQTAYRRAPLTSSVPVLNVVNPLVALLYGALAFHERPAHGAAALSAEAIGLLTVLAGVFFLARQGERAAETTEADAPLTPAL